MENKEIIEKILETIGKDDDLLNAFASVMNIPSSKLEEICDYAEIVSVKVEVPPLFANGLTSSQNSIQSH